MKFFKYSILVITLISTTAFSQSLSVVAGINEKNTVTIKWFSNHVFNIEGVNVYRRELPGNEWFKLNSTVIKRADDVSKTSTDSLLRYYSILTYNKPSNPEDEGIWRLAVISTGILEPKFSEFYGMQFIDDDVIQNRTYEYRVVKIENGRETEGSISNRVKIEQFKKPEPPTDFKANEDDGKVNFIWNHNKKKFFAYNIYRSETANAPKVKINKHPIIVFGFRNEAGALVTPEKYFVDTSLINGREYFYELTGIDFLGRESSPTKEIKIVPKDKTPPSEAYDLNLIFKSDTVQIIWRLDSEEDLKEINIYRGKTFEGPFEKINNKPLNQKSREYFDIIKETDQLYFYLVETVDYAGNVNRSFPRSIMIPDLKPPAAPKNLSAAGEIGRVILKWDKNSDKDLLGYFVLRSISGREDDFLLLNTEPVETNIYIDTLPKEIGNFITYKTKAVDKNYNESEYSNPVKVKMIDVTAPSKPILLKVESDGLEIRLEWLPNPEKDLFGYDVFINSSETEKAFTKLNKEKIRGTKYSTKLTLGGNYKFYVNASDISGNVSENSDTLECSVIFEPEIGHKLNFSAFFDTAKKSTILMWDDVKEFIGYLVFRRDKNEELYEAISELIKVNYFEDKDGEKARYYYFIRAFDEAGNSYDTKELSP